MRTRRPGGGPAGPDVQGFPLGKFTPMITFGAPFSGSTSARSLSQSYLTHDNGCGLDCDDFPIGPSQPTHRPDGTSYRDTPMTAGEVDADITSAFARILDAAALRTWHRGGDIDIGVWARSPGYSSWPKHSC